MGCADLMYRATEKTQENARKRHDAIAEAARLQIIEGGFASATVKAVAHRANCSSGLIYQYFPSAEELLKGAFAHVSAYELSLFRRGLEQHQDIGHAMDTAVNIFLGRSLQGPRLADALLFEALPPLVEEERLRFRRSWTHAISQRLDRAIADGQLAIQNTVIVGTGLTGALAENLLPRLHHATVEQTHLPVQEFISTVQILCRKMIGLPNRTGEGI